MGKADKERRIKVNFIKRKLLQTSLPRVQVSIILLLTALAGFLTSFSLLQAGISSMTLRYPIAIIAAYCVFLLLLRIWLWFQKNSLNIDLSGADFGGSNSSAPSGGNFQFGGGTDFAGGGAGGNWEDRVATSADMSGGSVLDGVSLDLDLEELGLIILAVAALIGGLLAALYIIYIAPVLLAEILVDGALVAGLYSRVKNIEQNNWLKTAVKRTVMPAVLVVIFFTIAGFAMQSLAPEAHSIGAVWQQIAGN